MRSTDARERVDVVLAGAGPDPLATVRGLVEWTSMDALAAMDVMSRLPSTVARSLDVVGADVVVAGLRGVGAVVSLAPADGPQSPLGSADGSGATAREAPSSSLQPGQATGATAREVEQVPVDADSVPTRGAFHRASLLPSLVGRFEVVRDLGAGGEADVLLVTNREGRRLVAKQYRQPGWSSDEEVLHRLLAARAGHTIESWTSDPVLRSLLWVDEWGQDPASGLSFEVAEYLPDGALSNLTVWPLSGLIDGLVAAVAAFHEAAGAHRDIKPANVLVRSGVGPVLVLADVGLARTLDASKRFSKRDGSAAYQAPEAAQGMVSRAGDWWAVGMMIAQAGLGYHPLALPDGSLPGDQVLLASVAQRDVPHLDRIHDERIEMLCRGLLARDSAARWGIDQVHAWQLGESPATPRPSSSTAAGAGSGLGAAPARTRLVRFAGRDHDSLDSLAAAFADQPDVAGDLLFGSRDAVLLEDLRLMLSAHGAHEAQAVIDRFRSGAWEPSFLRLLAEMDPGLTPVLAGQDMTPTGIAVLAQQIIGAGQATFDQTSAMDWVIDHDLWRIWRTQPGMDSGIAGERVQYSMRAWKTEELLGSVGALDSKRLVRSSPSGAAWVSTAPSQGLPQVGPELISSAGCRAFWSQMMPLTRAWIVLEAADPKAARSATTDALVPVQLRVEGPLHAPAGRGVGSEKDATEEWSKRVSVENQVPDQNWWTSLVAQEGIHQRILAVLSLGLAKEAQHALADQLRREAERTAEAEARRVRLAEARRRAKDSVGGTKLENASFLDRCQDELVLSTIAFVLVELGKERKRSFLVKDWNRIGELEDRLKALGLKVTL